MTGKELSDDEDYDDEDYNEEDYTYRDEEHIEDPDYIYGLEGFTDKEIADIKRRTVDGLFPDDGYDYSRHVRDRGEGEVINALEVAAVAQLGDELTEVYKPPVLKTDARTYDIDGNVIEATVQEDSEDEDVEIIEDENGDMFEDFLKELDGDKNEYPDDDDEYDDDEEYYSDEDTKTQGSIYSTKREVQQQIDDEFDKLMADEYTYDKIGELDGPESQGVVKIKDIHGVVDSFLDSTKTRFDNLLIQDYYDDGEVDMPSDRELKSQDVPEGMYLLTQEERLFGRNDVTREEVLDLTKKLLELKRQKKREQGLDSDDESDEEYEEIEMPQEQKWDCESIISTYSNLENHPKMIIEKRKVKLSAKTGIPLGVLEEKKKPEEETDEQDLSENMGVARGKDETPDEKKERKKFVKMYKKMMREQKKSLKDAYKNEEIRQGKVLAQPHARQKVVVKY
jgi:protein LTV1